MVTSTQRLSIIAGMNSRIENIRKSFFGALETASTRSELLETKGKFLGKKGVITSLLAQIKDLQQEERSGFGQDVNRLKGEAFKALKDRLDALDGKSDATDLPDLAYRGFAAHEVACILLPW